MSLASCNSAGLPSLARAYGCRVSSDRRSVTVFVANDYLIKGVAGAIIWKLLRDQVEAGRWEFTNRELRLDPDLRLPGISDNLEARLILLQRRLAERCPFLAIEKTGRGRFRLDVFRPLQLTEVPGR